MTPDELYESWRHQRQGIAPTDGLTDRIMAAVEACPVDASRVEVAVTSAGASKPGSFAQRWGPAFLCLAASLIFVARITAIVGNLVFPTGNYPEFAADQRIEDFHDHRPATRS